MSSPSTILNYNSISSNTVGDWEKQVPTIGGETNRGALRPIGMGFIHAGVAALILDGNGLDGELTVGQGSSEPDSSLVLWLDHGVAPLCKGGYIFRFSLGRLVLPNYLLDLFRQTIGARKEGLFATHCCFVVVDGDLS